RGINHLLDTPEPEGPPAPHGACAAELSGREAFFARDLATAREELARSLESWSKLGAVWPAARVQLALAQALRGDDPAAASYHAKQALDVFEALGSRDEIERSRALL